MIIVLLLFCACKEDRKRQNIQQVVAEWTGKEILFPAGIPCQSSGADNPCIDFSNQNYKILLYVDSAGCSSCRLKQLSEWKRIIEETDSLFSGEVDFLFFFQPKKQDEKELQYIFRGNDFIHPVFIDTKNEIEKLNNFPSQIEYQCFLLDRDNKVLMIGNPSINNAIWQLFRKIIIEGDGINQGKKEESLTFLKPTTLPPTLPTIRKEAAKVLN